MHQSFRDNDFEFRKEKISTRLHFDRAAGRHCHHCTINGDINARSATGKETGKIGGVQGEHAPMEPDMGYVLPG